jgi:hypothetical protein
MNFSTETSYWKAKMPSVNEAQKSIPATFMAICNTSAFEGFGN